MLAYILVAVGGAIGSVSRYWLSGLVATRYGEAFPWGTLVINVTGSFVIGIFAALTTPDIASTHRLAIRQFFMVGICGGYTTFSSFSLQTLDLLRDRQWLYAGGNVILSVIFCMVAVWLGYMLGTVFNTMKGS